MSTTTQIVGVIKKVLADYEAALARATPNERACYGDYVIRTSAGLYYREGSTTAMCLLNCSRYMDRLGAGLTARHLRDGAGNKGEVVEYRKALQDEIADTEALIAKIEEHV